MRLRPDDLPEMVKDEARNVVFKLGGAVGVNTISGTPTVESVNGLTTFGAPSVSGTSVTVKVTAANTGSDVIKLTAVLSSGETIIGPVRVRITDPAVCYSRDYN